MEDLKNNSGTPKSNFMGGFGFVIVIVTVVISLLIIAKVLIG